MKRQKNKSQIEPLKVHYSNVRSEKQALLIEDDHLIFYLHNRYLKTLGYTVDVAHTQQEALEYAFKKRYQLIVSDLGLSDSCYETIVTNLRASPSVNQKTPLIIVTAINNEIIKSRCLKAGANEFMVKPISKMLLEKTLKKLFSHEKTFSFQRSEANL